MAADGHGRTGSGVPSAEPPRPVRLPVNVHRWETMTFLHWPLDPRVVQRVVPPELRVLTFEGAAWVGITPFRIRVRLPGTPWLPGRRGFPETNVRTYVAAGDRQGVWFLRMEAARLWLVTVLRTFGLPYVWPRMAIGQRNGTVGYVSRPRTGAAPEAGSRVVVRPGPAVLPPGGPARDRFLTARWGAFHRRGRLWMYTPVEHPPWPLRSAAVDVWDVASLFHNAGLPPPADPPVAHFSSGVAVTVGAPEAARRHPPRPRAPRNGRARMGPGTTARGGG